MCLCISRGLRFMSEHGALSLYRQGEHCLLSKMYHCPQSYLQVQRWGTHMRRASSKIAMNSSLPLRKENRMPGSPLNRPHMWFTNEWAQLPGSLIWENYLHQMLCKANLRTFGAMRYIHTHLLSNKTLNGWRYWGIHCQGNRQTN